MVFANVKNSGGQTTEGRLPGAPANAPVSNPIVTTLEKECAGVLKFLRVVENYAKNPDSLLNDNDVASLHRHSEELRQVVFKAQREAEALNGALGSESRAKLDRPKELVYEYIARFNSLHSASRPELVPGQRLVLLNALACSIKDSMPRQWNEIFNEINRSMGARHDL